MKLFNTFKKIVSDVKNNKDILYYDENYQPKRTNLTSEDTVNIYDGTPKSSNIFATLAKKIGLSFGGDGRDFESPELDFTVIDKAYDTEGYIRQGIDKYIDKMFKAGWQFVGKNPNTVEYVKQRFDFMAEVTQIPTEKLFIEYSEDVVKFSNAILAKSRMTDQTQLPPGVTVNGLNGQAPIVGYFPLNVTTMKVKRDKTGMVKQWQQEVPGQDKSPKFKPEDIIHTYYKRKKGYAFGTPFLLPALDDARALRQCEDNVLKMLYRNIYPFYQIKIGSADFPADDEEITAATEKVNNMELDGGLVTSERWDISAVAADKIIDAHQYMKYFEDRLFSDLGVPSTMFGRGATANKDTSDNMGDEFIDRVKAFQKVIEADVNQLMIKELLREGGFDPNLNQDDMVYFKFNEIDIDMQIKLENQAVYLYEHSAVTEDEMRRELGRDPISDSDREKMFINLVKNSDDENGTAETNNKVNPKNQHTQNSINKNSLILEDHFNNLLNKFNKLSSYDDISNLKIELNISQDILAKYSDINTEQLKNSFKSLISYLDTINISKANIEEIQQKIKECKNKLLTGGAKVE